MTQPFKIGRANLYSGAPRTDNIEGAPMDLRQQGDRLLISGRWAPAEIGTTTSNGIIGRSQAFRQQWLGMSETPGRTVPIVAPNRYNIDGFWFPTSTDITELPAVTYSQGVFDYQGEFQRIAPSYAQAGEGFQGTLGVRDLGTHAVTANGWLWWPDAVTWDEQSTYGASEEIKAITDAGVIKVGGEFSDVTNGTGILQQLAFATEPENVYAGAATIERVAGDGTWYPIMGRQLTDVSDPAQVRIGNGLVRAVFVTGSDETDTHVALECYSQSTQTWGAVGTFQMQLDYPTATPAVVIESNEVVALRYPVREWAPPSPTGRSGFITLTCKRGARWIEVDFEASIVPSTYYITETTPGSNAAAVTGGLLSQTVSADGHRWFMVSPYEQPGFSNPAISSIAINGAQMTMALIADIDNTGFATKPFGAQWGRDDYWKINSARTYPVTL